MKLLVIIFLIFPFLNALAIDRVKPVDGICKVNGLKVVSSISNHYYFGNLFGSIQLSLNLGKSDANRSLIMDFESIKKNNQSFSIEYKAKYDSCLFLDSAAQIISINIEDDFQYENSHCLNLGQSKAFFSVINFEDFNAIIQNLHGQPIDAEKFKYIKENITKIAHNSLKSLSGIEESLIFYSIFFELLYEQGVRKISRQEFLDMINYMNLDLSKEYLEFAKIILRELDVIILEKKNNDLHLELKFNNDLKITQKNIPSVDGGISDEASSYFKNVKLDKKTKIVIKNSKMNSPGEYQTGVEIQGMSVELDIPVYGKLKVAPKKLKLYSNSRSTVESEFGEFIQVSKNLYFDFLI